MAGDEAPVAEVPSASLDVITLRMVENLSLELLSASKALQQPVRPGRAMLTDAAHPWPVADIAGALR